MTPAYAQIRSDATTRATRLCSELDRTHHRPEHDWVARVAMVEAAAAFARLHASQMSRTRLPDRVAAEAFDSYAASLTAMAAELRPGGEGPPTPRAA